MKPIGGFLQLDCQRGNNIHDSALALNTGRNALEVFLESNSWIEKVWLPFYHCEVLIEPLMKIGVNYSFYKINSDFLPKALYLGKNEIALYINFFGICDKQVIKLAGNYADRLVVDNTQAFFSNPIKDTACTFYSARKFFGVPDGAYLYSKEPVKNEIDQDVSYQRCEHLLKRWDLGPEPAYQDFKNNDEALSGQPVKKMSRLTRVLLQNIDYEQVHRIRHQNFRQLHQFFSEINELALDLESIGAPLCYPFLTESGASIKKQLIEKKIFIPTYWPNLEDIVPTDSFESHLINNLVCLPIDQRYSTEDMDYIISTYQKLEKRKTDN